MSPDPSAAPADLELQKKAAGEKAVDEVKSGMVVGLGTGSTAVHAVKKLGQLVRQGLKVRGVPTSEATRRLADAEGIPLLTFDDVTSLDLAIDGADEADARLALIKGGGGALLREKVVARAAKRFVVIADSTKLVPTLGAFPLPVEVIPFASRVVADEIRRLGGEPFLRRTKDGATYVTDNGNWILDCRFGPITHPGRLASALDGVPGIAEHGLFVNMAALLIVGLPGGATRTLTPQDG